MKIVVCMKQVPASSKVDIDPETGAMKRMSGETRTNPYDLFALETALQIREKVGGTVTVLTMGPPQAEEMMRDAYTMGADDAVILSDSRCACHLLCARTGDPGDRRRGPDHLRKTDNRWRYRTGRTGDRRTSDDSACCMGGRDRGCE